METFRYIELRRGNKLLDIQDIDKCFGIVIDNLSDRLDEIFPIEYGFYKILYFNADILSKIVELYSMTLSNMILIPQELDYLFDEVFISTFREDIFSKATDIYTRKEGEDRKPYQIPIFKI